MSSAVCAICQSPLAPQENRTPCPACGAEYHADCWTENCGCAVYGCSEVPAVEQRTSLEIPVSFWGQENKPCPCCSREILAAAIRCRHCGATFASAAPEDSETYQRRSELEQQLPKTRNRVVLLFILSVLPCTAPVGAIVSLVWHLTRKREIEALPALYPALCKIGIGVGLGQTVLAMVMALLYAARQAP